MKKLSILLVSLYFYSAKTHAQSGSIDSLRQLLTTSKEDSNRVKSLYRLGSLYSDSKPDSTLILATDGLLLSRRIRFLPGEASCLNILGDAADNIGDYPKALGYYLQSMKINEKLNNETGIRRSIGAIGTVYVHQGDFGQALEYTFRAKALAEKQGNKRALAVYLLNIGDDYNQIKQFDSARIYNEQCYDLATTIDDADLRGTALNNLGLVYSSMGQDERALEYFRRGIPFLESEDDDDVLCETYLGMAKNFLSLGRTDSALHYSKLSYTISKEAGFIKRIYDASLFLTNYFKENKKFDSAFSYQQIAIETKDSLFSQEKTKQIQTLSFQEKLRQQEIAAAKLKAIEERKNNLQLLGITAFIVTFILFFLLIVRRKTKPATIEFFGVVSLLLVFEFISLFIHPYIEEWTHHTPIYMLLILVGIASILVPLHHKMEKIIKEKLARKIHHPALAGNTVSSGVI